MSYPQIMTDILTTADFDFKKRFFMNGRLYATSQVICARCPAKGETDTAGDFGRIVGAFDWKCPKVEPVSLPIVGIGLELGLECDGDEFECDPDEECDCEKVLLLTKDAVQVSPTLRLATWAIGLLRANGVTHVYPRKLNLVFHGAKSVTESAYFKTEQFEGYIAGMLPQDAEAIAGHEAIVKELQGGAA